MRHLGIISVFTFFLAAALAWLNKMQIDGFLTYLLIGVLFLAVYFCLLDSSRRSGQICHNRSNQYKELMWCYGASCLVTLLFCFFPPFTCPVILFSLFISIFSNQEIGISTGIFFCIFLCNAVGMSYYELAAYCLLVIFGAQAAKTMHDRKLRLYGSMILFAVSVSIPMLFYYLANGTSSGRVLICNIVFSLIVICLYVAFADRFYDKSDYEEDDSIEKIIGDEFPLVSDIKHYSKAEYVHAMKVSTIALKCADEIGANKLVVAAAGFYYRVGILEGEPFIQNGVRLAFENSFPESIITILSEYNGEEKLPSTRESAIVHMVDSCLKKSEMLNSHNLSTSWNQDMVIYQTLNELSATGIYDESGLSMNQFLKVRELLVREELGYDNYN